MKSLGPFSFENHHRKSIIFILGSSVIFFFCVLSFSFPELSNVLEGVCFQRHTGNASVQWITGENQSLNGLLLCCLKASCTSEFTKSESYKQYSKQLSNSFSGCHAIIWPPSLKGTTLCKTKTPTRKLATAREGIISEEGTYAHGLKMNTLHQLAYSSM